MFAYIKLKLTLRFALAGAVCFGLGFRNLDYKDAFILMGSVIIASVVPTALIFIKGHSSLFCGQDEVPLTPSDAAKGILTVPEPEKFEEIEEEVDC